MIGMKCSKCGNIQMNTREHLEAHWDQAFTCEPGCGRQMKIDRDEARRILDSSSADQPAIIPMHEVS